MDEHQPKHVHVAKGQEFAKINLETLAVIRVRMKSNSPSQMLAIAKEHQAYLLEKWNEYFDD